MKCPQCNNPMKEGFVHLTPVGNGALFGWTDQEPNKWKFKKSAENKTLMKCDLFHLKKKNWLRRASVCEKCDLYTFINKWGE